MHDPNFEAQSHLRGLLLWVTAAGLLLLFLPPSVLLWMKDGVYTYREGEEDVSA